MTIRVSITSQYPLLVAGLKKCLEKSSDIKIVSTSKNISADYEYNSQKVDILIISQESLQTIQSNPLLDLKKILMCDQKVLENLTDEEIHLIDDVIFCKDNCACIIETIKSVYFGYVKSNPVIKNMHAQTQKSMELDDSFTSRESEILKLIANGLTNQQISNKLEIAERTVEFHITNIYKKTGADSRVELTSLFNQ